MTFHDQVFTKAQLDLLSPWVVEQLAEIDQSELDSVLFAISGNANPAQPMRVWTRAVERCHSIIWRSIDAQG